MLADDLTWSIVESHHKTANGSWRPGRMVVETSPCNYQVWIRSSQHLTSYEKRYWLKKMCSDPGATPKNRWGRMPGFRNRKEKYRTVTGQYPLSRLIWVDWKRKALIPDVKPSGKVNNSMITRTNNFKNTDICRSNFEKGNESVTDFSYALALARRGYDADQIKLKIIAERINWENHSGEKRQIAYLNRTVFKAIKIIATS